MTERKNNSISRRDILAGTGVVAGALALSATGNSQADQTSGTAATEHWDRETDIVCVGGGAAGCTAAVIAAAKGNQVMVIDKGPVLGGTTNKSGGVGWVPNNMVLKANGIDDARDDCLRYMARFSYPQRYTPDSPTLGLEPREYKLIEAFYDNGSVALEALKETGAIDFGEFSVGAGVGAPPDYADHLPENKVPRGRAIVPIGPDGEPTPGRVGDGIYLILPMEDWLTEKGMPILTETEVTRVIQSDGRVVGVEIKAGDRTERVRARKGVIFATGGYAQSAELIHKHQKAIYGACAVPEATGDFIRIAGAAGAQMGDLSTAWRSQVVLDEALDDPRLPICAFVLPGDSMIVVNKHGQRVFNEKRNYNDRTEVHFQYDPVAMDYPNQLLFMLFDSRAVDAFGDQYPIPHKPDNDTSVVQGATLEELAENLTAKLNKLSNQIGGCSLASDFTAKLNATVNQYNDYAATGEDLGFGRGSYSYDRIWQAYFSMMRDDTTQEVNTLPNNAMYPLSSEGPYYAVILVAGALDTSGGPQTNEKAQVLDTLGTPIPGLYGAGNCVASPSKEAYYGAGGTIGMAMAFGYIAAVNADAESA